MAWIRREDYIDHPDTAKRQAEVEAIKQRMAETPRFELRHSCPTWISFRSVCAPRNERIDESLGAAA